MIAVTLIKLAISLIGLGLSMAYLLQYLNKTAKLKKAIWAFSLTWLILLVINAVEFLFYLK